MALAAIHRDAVPARYQARGKLFGERFKPAVAGRDPPRPENRNPRRVPPPPASYCLPPTALDRASARPAAFDLAAGRLTGS